MHHIKEPMEMMVGYEPTVAMLRIERVSPSRTTDILADYQNNRSYHRLRRYSRTRQADYVFDQILKTDQELFCVVTQLNANNNQNSVFRSRPQRPSLGKLLLGTEKLFYLGLARVRGVEARVYEAHDCEWPLWFEQPTIFEDGSRNGPEASASGTESSDRFYARQSHGPFGGFLTGFELILNCVFYFSQTVKSADDEYQPLDSTLVLVEVFKMSKDNRVLDMIPIQIYDFSWQLNAMAPNNQHWPDFFSLGDDCVANTDSQYATIDLTLEIPLDDKLRQNIDWLQEPTRRNLAFLRSAQEFDLRPSVIYDLESRIEQARTSRNDTASSTIPGQVLKLTMKAASRIKDVARMVFLGSADIRSGQLMYEKFIVVMAFSLQSCSLLVAHRRIDSAFIYDPITTRCFLFKGFDGYMIVPRTNARLPSKRQARSLPSRASS
jgi:hypothetical protein